MNRAMEPRMPRPKRTIEESKVTTVAEMGELLTFQEVAGILKVHIVTVTGWVTDGIIPAIKLTYGTSRIARKDLDRFVLSGYGAKYFDRQEEIFKKLENG